MYLSGMWSFPGEDIVYGLSWYPGREGCIYQDRQFGNGRGGQSHSFISIYGLLTVWTSILARRDSPLWFLLEASVWSAGWWRCFRLPSGRHPTVLAVWGFDLVSHLLCTPNSVTPATTFTLRGLFMNKYIFPGADASCSLGWVVNQVEAAGFEVKNIDVLGVHYSATIWRWYKNWVSNKEKVIESYGERCASSSNSPRGPSHKRTIVGIGYGYSSWLILLSLVGLCHSVFGLDTNILMPLTAKDRRRFSS